MDFLVALLIACLIVELVCYYLAPNAPYKPIAALALIIIAGSSILILGLRPALWSALLAYFSVFRLINLLKLIDGRKQINYLRSSFIRSSLILVGCQLAVLCATYLLSLLGLSQRAGWSILAGLALIGAVIVALSLRRALVKTRPPISQAYREDKSLPALTIALPARNETKDLEDCLKSIIESDYPKLEILVLDDCSQEKRTPEIIRQFAESGVRFLAGKAPSESWTAKNYAYEQLAAEANGELLMFAGVDIRLERQTARRMVELMLSKRKSMVSFMPINDLPDRQLKRLLIQPVRYLWELGLPRRSFNRPPVLSSCWLISKNALSANGGFKAVSRSILPERYFARQASRQQDGYSFVALGENLGLSSSKSFEEQLSTGVRTRYPLLKQRLENISLVVLIELTIYASPVGFLLFGMIAGSLTLVTLSLPAIIITRLVFLRIVRLTYGRNLYLSLLAYPLVFGYDIGLAIYSMWRYEFREVVWKDRNVCIPVMHVISKLPSLDSDSKPV